MTYHSHYAVTEPGLVIRPGETVQTDTLDAHGGSPEGKLSSGFSNPLNGPFVIEEAEPGDMLVVLIESIEPRGQAGWGYAYPRPWLLEAADAESLRDKKAVQWTLENEGEVASSSYFDGKQLTLPMMPMLGCVGVACPAGQTATSQEAGRFGGNLDFPLLRADTQIELPVLVRGGYLFVGDAHALQFPGEMTGAAVEIPARVTFSVTVKKQQHLQWPRGETLDELFTLGSDKPFESAVQHAVSGMIHLLQERYSLSHADAAALTAHVGDIQVCNLVGPQYTAACLISRANLMTFG
jgi:Predicted acetamidase/formamidase